MNDIFQYLNLPYSTGFLYNNFIKDLWKKLRIIISEKVMNYTWSCPDVSGSAPPCRPWWGRRWFSSRSGPWMKPDPSHSTSPHQQNHPKSQERNCTFASNSNFLTLTISEIESKLATKKMVSISNIYCLNVAFMFQNIIKSANLIFH